MVDTRDTNADIWKSAEVARTFAVEAGQREARRRDYLQLLARLLPFGPEDKFTFVDLGAGTGAASRVLLDEYPRASAILAEYSPAMTAEGERSMAPYAGRYRYVELDMNSGDWGAMRDVHFDAAVSALSIHHLPDQRKRGIFRELNERLPAGGWYLNFDTVKAADAEVETIWERVNDRYDPEAAHKRAHRTEHEQARYENHVRHMLPLEPQLGWLREAGFEAVDVYWKRLELVIYGGRKPA